MGLFFLLRIAFAFPRRWDCLPPPPPLPYSDTKSFWTRPRHYFRLGEQVNTKYDDSIGGVACFFYYYVITWNYFQNQYTHCVFCQNNGEDESYYMTHTCKDDDGFVLCPILRAYVCPICSATGSVAHTIKYCPQNKVPDPELMINDVLYEWCVLRRFSFRSAPQF